jgi:hypothetical protein
MVSIVTARKLALSKKDAVEMPHFEKSSFRVGGKIFMTLDTKRNRACLKMTPEDQDVFSLIDKAVIYPVPNTWGQQGWTFIELAGVKKDVFCEALHAAFITVGKTTVSKKKKP